MYIYAEEACRTVPVVPLSSKRVNPLTLNPNPDLNPRPFRPSRRRARPTHRLRVSRRVPPTPNHPSCKEYRRGGGYAYYIILYNIYIVYCICVHKRGHAIHLPHVSRLVPPTPNHPSCTIPGEERISSLYNSLYMQYIVYVYILGPTPLFALAICVQGNKLHIIPAVQYRGREGSMFYIIYCISSMLYMCT